MIKRIKNRLVYAERKEEFMNIEIKEEKKWFNLSFDTSFKSFYTTKGNEELLFKLISDVLNRNTEFKCFRPVEISLRTIKERKKVLDVLVETTDGKTVLVEVNTDSSNTILLRNINYLHSYSSQLVQRGQKYRLKDQFILINFNFGDEHDYTIKTYHYRADDDGSLLTNCTTIINVNVDKILEEWYNQRNEEYMRIAMLGMDRNGLVKLAKSNEEAEYVLRSLDKMNSDERFVRLMTEEEEKLFMEQGLKEEGIEQGIEQGKNQERINIIKKLLKKGLSKEEISNTLEISVEDIEKILES